MVRYPNGIAIAGRSVVTSACPAPRSDNHERRPRRPGTLHRPLAGWRGSERANFQSFVADLCTLLGVPPPDPAREDTRDNAYVFERRITFRHGDGSSSAGFMDCYRRACLVMEGKKIRAGAPRPFDDALQRARGQGENYARSLPADETRPPFVVDVGNVIELYAEFSRSGATYNPLPRPALPPHPSD